MGAIKVNIWCRPVTSQWRLKPSVQGSSCTAGIIQSAGVITAQSAQTPSVRHTWGPAIRSDTPNGYQGCRAAINYYSSTLATPLLPLSVFFSPFFHLLYSHQQFYLRSISHLFSRAPVSLSGTSQIVQSNGGFIHHQRAGGAGRKSGRRSIEMESHCLRVSQEAVPSRRCCKRPVPKAGTLYVQVIHESSSLL